MSTTLSTLELRRQLGEVLDRVALRYDQFVIQRKGKALAAVVPVSKLEQMERFAREQALAALRNVPRTKLSDAKAMRLADEAKHASRARKPARRARRR